jgi:hypothetical protein
MFLTYAEELEHLVMSGLSLTLAVSSALTLTQAAVKEVSQIMTCATPVNAIPAAKNLLFPSQMGINTPIFYSTRQNGLTPLAGFQSVLSMLRYRHKQTFLVLRDFRPVTSINCHRRLRQANHYPTRQ